MIMHIYNNALLVLLIIIICYSISTIGTLVIIILLICWFIYRYLFQNVKPRTIEEFIKDNKSNVNLAICHGKNHNQANLKLIDSNSHFDCSNWYYVDIWKAANPDIIGDATLSETFKAIPDNTFDKIAIISCPIEVNNQSILKKIMINVNRLLKPSGKIYIDGLPYFFQNLSDDMIVDDKEYDELMNKISKLERIPNFEKYICDKHYLSFDFKKMLNEKHKKDGLKNIIVSWTDEHNNNNEILDNYMNKIYLRKSIICIAGYRFCS